MGHLLSVPLKCLLLISTCKDSQTDKPAGFEFKTAETSMEYILLWLVHVIERYHSNKPIPKHQLLKYCFSVHLLTFATALNKS